MERPSLVARRSAKSRRQGGSNSGSGGDQDAWLPPGRLKVIIFLMFVALWTAIIIYYTRGFLVSRPPPPARGGRLRRPQHRAGAIGMVEQVPFQHQAAAAQPSETHLVRRGAREYKPLSGIVAPNPQRRVDDLTTAQNEATAVDDPLAPPMPPPPAPRRRSEPRQPPEGDMGAAQTPWAPPPPPPAARPPRRRPPTKQQDDDDNDDADGGVEPWAPPPPPPPVPSRGGRSSNRRPRTSKDDGGPRTGDDDDRDATAGGGDSRGAGAGGDGDRGTRAVGDDDRGAGAGEDDDDDRSGQARDGGRRQGAGNGDESGGARGRRPGGGKVGRVERKEWHMPAKYAGFTEEQLQDMGMARPLPRYPAAEPLENGIVPLLGSVPSEPFDMTVRPRKRERDSLVQVLSSSFRKGEPFLDNEYWKRPENVEAAKAFRRYIKLHKHALDHPDEDSSKFLVVKPAAQSGNRMLAIVSGFLFALMTDRALIVNNHGFFASLGDLWNKPGFDWTPRKFRPGDRSNGAYFHFSGESRNAKWMELLQCGSWNMTHKTLHFHGNQYLPQIMRHNPRYARKLQTLFPLDMFGTIGRFLFRPCNKLHQMVLKWKHQLNWDSYDYIMAFHVRSPGLPAMTKEEFQMYADAAVAATPEELRAPGSNVLWFVATDRARNQEYLKAEWADPSRTVAVIEPFLKSNKPHAVRQAMADMLLISMADDAVLSGWSTFGNVAAGLAQDLLPMLVTEIRDKREARKHAWEVVDKRNWKTAKEWPPRLKQSSQRVPDFLYLFMNVPHYSFVRSGAVRVSTKQPCCHLYAYYAPDKTSCWNPDWALAELANGRYC